LDSNLILKKVKIKCYTPILQVVLKIIIEITGYKFQWFFPKILQEKAVDKRDLENAKF
jgi:hypothetical protein